MNESFPELLSNKLTCDKRVEMFDLVVASVFAAPPIVDITSADGRGETARKCINRMRIFARASFVTGLGVGVDGGIGLSRAAADVLPFE